MPEAADAQSGAGEELEVLRNRDQIGEVGGETLEVEGELSVPVSELQAAYEGAIPAAFAG